MHQDFAPQSVPFPAMNVTRTNTAVRPAPDEAAHKFVVVLAAHDHRESGSLVARLRDGPEAVRVVRNEVVHAVTREHVAAPREIIAAIDEIWWSGGSPEHTLGLLRAAYATQAVLQLSLVHERTIFARRVEGPVSMKRLSLLKRKPELSRQQVAAYWHDVHAPMASCHRHVARYVQNHLVADAWPDAPFDGLAEFRITDLAGMQMDYETDAGKEMRADVQNFAAAVSTYVVHEKSFPTRMQLSTSTT